MLKTKTARWAALTALACVAVLGIAWVLLISPRRAETAEIRDLAEASRQENEALQLKVAQLKAQFVELPKNKAELTRIYTQMPPTSAMPELVRSVDAAASASGVTLKALTPSSAVAVAAQGAQSAQGAAPTPAAEAPSATDGAPANPKAAAPGGLRVVAIPVTVIVEGDYFQTALFLKKLQTEMPRAFAVGTLQLAVNTTSDKTTANPTPKVTLTVIGKVFALPDATASHDAAAGSSGASASATPGTEKGAGSTGASGQSAAMGGLSRVSVTLSRAAEDS